jgi:transcriptional regulator NrdR family protein
LTKPQQPVSQETCPLCGSHNFGVIDSRPSGSARRRRKKCFYCGHRWTTIELRATEWQAMIGEAAGLAEQLHQLARALDATLSSRQLFTERGGADD